MNLNIMQIDKWIAYSRKMLNFKDKTTVEVVTEHENNVVLKVILGTTM